VAKKRLLTDEERAAFWARRNVGYEIGDKDWEGVKRVGRERVLAIEEVLGGEEEEG
jgi:hypothetical protein